MKAEGSGQLITIGYEKTCNLRLGDNKTDGEFVDIMNGLYLPCSYKIDFTFPSNELIN